LADETSDLAVLLTDAFRTWRLKAPAATPTDRPDGL
jgi:hypothetical protein